MTYQPYSLQKKLLIYTSVFSIVMGCILVFSAYRTALEETNEILDAQMEYLAKRVAKFAPQPEKSHFFHLKQYHEEDLFVDVWAYDDKTDRSHEFNLLVEPKKQAGFYPQETVHGTWQTYILPLKDVQIQISQQEKVRQSLALELAINMFLPYLILMPFAIWGLSVIIRKNFKPFEAFKKELIERKPNELTPIDSEKYPMEIIPSIIEINDLFQKISDAQQEQKQFVADAAHELRTPITALNLQTQILMQELPENTSIVKLNKGLIRTQHLVGQLLKLAQQDASNATEEPKVEVNLKEIAIQCVEQLIHLSLEKDIDLGMEQQQDIILQSYNSSLHTIIFNLIDNAIKYTPIHGVINVSTYEHRGRAIIRVEDNGPGIPPELYERILQRFYRVHQHIETGSGLGLAIVSKATERVGAKLSFNKSESLGGLCVEVSIPLTSELSHTK